MIILPGSPLEIEQKRRLVKGLTDVAAEIFHRQIIVMIREGKAENVCISGQLFADREKEEKE